MKSGKNVVITGSSRGIGFAMAAEFLKAGCTVTLSGKSKANLGRALKSFAEYRKRVHTCVCDVTKEKDLERLWKVSKKRWGRVDIWINNAGIAQDYTPAWEIVPKRVGELIATNIMGVINGTSVAVKGMKVQGGGQIFNMEGFGSDGRLMKNLTLYGTSKSAVRYFTRGLAHELAGSPILAGSLSPGMMATDFILQPLRKNPGRLGRSLRVFNIIADKPETVARFLVPRMLANKKQGARFRWLAGPKLFWRFLSAGFKKRDIIRL